MTPEQCRTKRNQLLAHARVLEKSDTFVSRATAERCRTMANNLMLAASDNEADAARGRALYDKSRADFETFISAQR